MGSSCSGGCRPAESQLALRSLPSPNPPLPPPADTIRTVEAYADIVVLRHFQAGSAEKAAAAASIPIINAGDGPGQHPTQVGGWARRASAMGRHPLLLPPPFLSAPTLPTHPPATRSPPLLCPPTTTPSPQQALLDVYTIQREIGRLEGFKIGLVGDLATGRTVRSLAYVLSMYKDVKMYFVAPDVVCWMGRAVHALLCYLTGGWV